MPTKKSKPTRPAERLEKGGEMYFISTRDYKVCHTNDWHFGSDDQRWNDCNYFLDVNAARACSIAIKEEYGEHLEMLDRDRENNRTTFIKIVREMAVQAKRLMRKAEEAEPVKDEPLVEEDSDEVEEEPVDEKERKRKKEKKVYTFELLAFELAEAGDAYEERNRAIAKEDFNTRKDIAEFIKHYPKK